VAVERGDVSGGAPAGVDAWRVYWQPGCTSCLRARELLRAHGIAFESINVRERPEALAALAARGLRTVPVVAHGERFVLAQDLDELAAFIGVRVDRERLPLDVLARRLERLLEIAAALVRALPPERWQERLPQRDRSWLDLGFHVAKIVQAFLAAARGGELRYEDYEERAPADAQSAGAVGDRIDGTREALAAWAAGAAAAQAAESARELWTYFGRRSAWTVLERSAWHVAQHVRQLQHLAIEVAGASPAQRLAPGDLAGLPVPEAIWDREISPAGAAADGDAQRVY
jgi:glutaredoxin